MKSGIEDVGWTLIAFVVIGMIFAAGDFGTKTLFGGESRGTVRYSDCRAVIQTGPDGWTAHLHRFICAEQLTRSGRSMGGDCAYVELTDDGTCTAAYVYTKPPAETCPASAPYLGADDKCYATLDTGNGGGQVYAPSGLVWDPATNTFRKR